MEQLSKRERILMAAGEVFGVHGFHQATMEQIAEAAGVGKGTVYLYFASKEDLFNAMLLEGSERVIQRVAESLKCCADPLERMHKLIAMHLQIIMRNLPAMQVLMREFTPSNLQGLRPELERHVQEYVALYVAVLEEGMATGVLRRHNPQVAALALLGAANQVGTHLAGGHIQLSLVACQQEIFDLVITGLQKGRK